MQESFDISLFQLAARYWKLGLICVCSCIGLAALATVFMPRRYESKMKFLVNNERADLVITPEKDPSNQTRSEVTETQVNTEIELLKSRDILESIVVDEKLYKAYERSKKNAPSRLAIELAAQHLQKNLGINALRKTNIIEVDYKASNPDLTVAILNDLGDRYLSAHLAAHSAPGSYKFFTEQVNKYATQLTQTRAALSVFHQRKHLFSMPQQQAALVEQLQSIEVKLKETTAGIAEQQSRLHESEQQLSTTPERVETQVKTVSNQYVIEHLQTMLADMRNKHIELAMKFKSNDRLLRELDDQITHTEQELAIAGNTKAVEQTTDLDTLHQVLKADNVKDRVALKGLETRHAELTGMQQAYLLQLGEMDKDHVTLQNLEQCEKEALENYQIYTHRLDEARLADSLDREKFSNVVIIERPVSSPIPVSPKLSLNLIFGSMMGLFLALAIAFIHQSKTSPPSIMTGKVNESLFPSQAFQTASGD